MAVLGERARRLLLRLSTYDLTVSKGRIRCDWTMAVLPDGDELGKFVDLLVELAENLTLREDRVPDQLAEHAANDASMSLHLRNLAVLQEHFPRSEATARASRNAIASPDPNLRLRGACGLGDEGHDTLASLAVSDQVPDRLRIEALKALAAGSSAKALSTLRVAARSSSEAVRSAASEAMAALVGGRLTVLESESRESALRLSDAGGELSVSEASATDGADSEESTISRTDPGRTKPEPELPE